MSALNSIIALPNTSVPGLIVICGPTATGKSGLAIALAQRLNSAIISADSRQVYREFNIGTAKPTAAEQQQAPHYLIDICDPTETLTLADYQEKAQALIEGRPPLADILLSQVTPQNHPLPPSASLPPLPPFSSPPYLLVGGTGLYIRSITRGLKIPRVSPQPALRSQLQGLGQVYCYALLQQVDPASAGKIHPHDQVRTLRALEVFYVTGCPMSQQQGEAPPPYPIWQIGLDCGERSALQRRIERRTQQMVEQGLVAEVESLCRKYGPDLPLLNTLGYAEFRQYLAGDHSLEQAIALTALHTRQFAKRQRTWFRADPQIEWFEADAPDLLEQVWQRLHQPPLALAL